jgi:hypothetical protein
VCIRLAQADAKEPARASEPAIDAFGSRWATKPFNDADLGGKTFRDRPRGNRGGGFIVGLEFYSSRREALEAAGLSE